MERKCERAGDETSLLSPPRFPDFAAPSATALSVPSDHSHCPPMLLLSLFGFSRKCFRHDRSWSSQRDMPADVQCSGFRSAPALRMEHPTTIPQFRFVHRELPGVFFRCREISLNPVTIYRDPRYLCGPCLQQLMSI